VTPVGNQYDVTFIFNESIQGFSANDIIASGGKFTTPLRPSGTGSSQFTATFLPDIQLIPTNAQLIIPRGSYKDLSGNLNDSESFNILLTPINSVVSKNSFNINSTHDLIDINYLDPLEAYSGVFLSSGNSTDFVYASNSSSVDNFKFKYVSGKFNLTGGDLNDYLDFGSFTTSGIRLIPYDYDSQSYLVDNNTGSAVTSLENVRTMGSIGSIEHVFGTSKSDWIEFFAGDDFTHIVDADEGNNYIKTADGDDQIFSGSGSDTVYSGGGNDRITLGDGEALVYAGVTLGVGDVLVSAGDGDNDISAGNGSNISIYAGIGNDHITLGDFASTTNIIHDLGGDNVITFGDGNFIVTLGDGNNSIHAGDGVNTFNLSDGIVSLNTGNGVNQITIDSNDRVTINTGSGADVVTIEQASSDLLEYDSDESDDTHFRYKSSANLIGNQYKLDITYSIAALSVPHSILFVEVLNSNNKVLTRKEIPVENNVSNEKLTLSYFGDVADGADSDEIQVKIHSYDNVDAVPIFTVEDIQLIHFYNGNTINVGDGNNTVNLQDGVYSVVAGKDNDEVTIGFGNSNINVGAGDDNIIHSQLFNGSQIFTIVASSSAHVHIDEFDISPSVAILRRLSINSGDKFSITVPSSELNNKSITSAILSKSADDIYIVELMDAGNNDKVLATIELEWQADPLDGHGGYELDLLPASKKTLPNGDLEYTSGLRYKLMNESLVGDSSTNNSDTLILNSGVINGAVELNSLIAVGGLGGDVYSFRIQSDSILTTQLSNTIVDSGSIGVNQKDSIYIEGIRTFQDLDFHRIEMVNEGVKSLRIDYQQYTGWEQFTSIDEGVVNVFGQFNPSSPQYRIERLQFSPVTNEDGQIFVDALQEYSFGTSKYLNAKDKTIELDTILNQKNSILIGQDDGSAIENFVINVTGKSYGTEKEVRIYGFDLNDAIKFMSPTKILDVTISDQINVDATTKWLDTTDSHRYSVDIKTGDTSFDHQLLTLILETGRAGAFEDGKDVFKYQ